jgi:biopolymer transport protein ExbB
VAGPVGEALIMTGLGLAVAIPAVMAYNAFTRGNRVLTGRLDAFAFELHSFLTLGHAPGAANQAAPAGGAQVRALKPAA